MYHYDSYQLGEAHQRQPVVELANPKCQPVDAASRRWNDEATAKTVNSLHSL